MKLDRIVTKIQSELPNIMDKEFVSAGAMNRKLNSPKEITSKGSSQGEWKGNKFVLNDEFIPKNRNPQHLTIGEIKRELNEKYNITLDGITYQKGVADFSSISVANISTEEMFCTITGVSSKDYKKLGTKEKVSRFATVFTKEKREQNFSIADGLAAKKQIKIPGLPDGYTKNQLKKWRKANRFSWDEQVSGGYNLVPTVIHQNLSHTGLVSVSENADKNLKKRAEELSNYPERHSWSESDAPVSVKELHDYISNKERKQGGSGMAKRNVFSRGMNLGRHSEVGYEELNKEAGDQISEGEKLEQLGEKFLSDKNKLEDQIEKVQAANISERDKSKLIAQLNAAIEALQEQYDEEVTEEERRVQEELQEQIEVMQETENELAEQVDSLRSVQMDAASTDASAAADAAEAQKQAYENMKNEYIQKLNLQMEQAEIQQRNIRNRRLSGR